MSLPSENHLWNMMVNLQQLWPDNRPAADGVDIVSEF